MTGATSAPRSNNQSIDGLLSGVQWSATSLTFSFPTDGSFYGSYPSSEPTNGFQSFSAVQQAGMRKVLALYSSFTGLTFTEIMESTSVHADIRFGRSDTVSPGIAYGNYPGEGVGGDVWFGKSASWEDPFGNPSVFFNFLHEVGHALGLKHGHETTVYGALPSGEDSREFSIMTYRTYVGSPVPAPFPQFSGFTTVPMVDDIAALQYMYGANYQTNSDNTVYSWSPTTGEESINGVGQGAPVGNWIFTTAWDGNGVDTYDFSQYGSNLSVDLRPGAWTTTAAAQLGDLDSSAPGTHLARETSRTLCWPTAIPGP